MADRINFSVHITPKETLTDEQGNDYDVISGEIGTSLGGSGDSINLADYSANGGYQNGAVAYFDAVHTANGVQLASSTKDFLFVKNTGFVFSSTTVLGASTTDCVLVVIKEVAHNSGVDGGYQNGSDVDEDHFYEIAWLKPGQAMILPLASSNLSISQFGSNSGDLSPLGQISQSGQARVFVKTIQSDGTAATDGAAVEYLWMT